MVDVAVRVFIQGTGWSEIRNPRAVCDTHQHNGKAARACPVCSSIIDACHDSALLYEGALAMFRPLRKGGPTDTLPPVETQDFDLVG